MFPHVGFYDYIIGGERTELDIIEEYVGAGLQPPPQKKKYRKNSGIAIPKWLKSIEGARRTMKVVIAWTSGLIKIRFNEKSMDWGITMFRRPTKNKKLEKTLNFGPKMIEIGPGSSENDQPS